MVELIVYSENEALNPMFVELMILIINILPLIFSEYSTATFQYLIPEKGYLKVKCVNDSAVILLTAIVNAWPGGMLEIVYAEMFPKLFLFMAIPIADEVKDSKILSMLGRENSRIKSHYCKIKERIWTQHGTQVMLEIDYESYLHIKASNSMVHFDSRQIDVVLVKGDILD